MAARPPRGRVARAQDPAHIRDLQLTVRRVFSPGLIKRLSRIPLRDRVLIKWMTIYKRLQPLGGTSEGNRITLYNEGDAAFGAMWSAIREAKKKVDLETYIFNPDAIGMKTLELLEAAAKRGCHVTLLYDGLGSMKLTEKELAPLRAAGGYEVTAVLTFNPLWKNITPGSWGTLLLRNHRKLLLVDDRVAFCGGMNIAKEYCGRELGGTGEFRDSVVKVEGSAIKDLEQVFLSSLDESGYLKSYPFWKRYPQKVDDLMKRVSEIAHESKLLRDASPAAANGGVEADEMTVAQTNTDTDVIMDEYAHTGVFVQVLQSNIRRNKRHIQKAFRVTLGHAVDRCYVTTPYFLPPLGVKRALLQAAERGMDVRVVTAGKTDVPIVRLAAQHIYSVFLKRGVKIYEMESRVLHAKTVTIDGLYGTIGSFNLDFWSSHRNLEVNLTVLDPDFSGQLEEQFFEDLKACREVTLPSMERRTILQKVIHFLAYQTCRIVAFLPFWPKGTKHEE